MVQFTGHFDGSVIRPDEQVEIPVNTPLRVTIEPATRNEESAVDWGRLQALARQCAVEGLADLAEHHDHYAHGKPVE